MNLRSEREAANTKLKLQLLEQSYSEVQADNDNDDHHLRELELESLKRLINQLKEEIARFEAHQPSA